MIVPNKERIYSKEDMHYCGELFACQIETREEYSDLIHIFIGDVYTYQYSVSAYWVNDIINIMNFVKKNANCKLTSE